MCFCLCACVFSCYTIAFIQSFVALQDVSCLCEYEQLCIKIRHKKYTFSNIHNSVYYIQDSIEREKEKKGKWQALG